MRAKDDRELLTLAEVGSAAAALAAGAALVTIRGEVDNAVVVLVLAAVVSACGALGGWRAGVAGAVFAALSFNFFHTEPYLSLRIHDADDVLTTATLMVVGAIAGVTSSVAHRRQARAVEYRSEMAAIERVADLVATGHEPGDVETAVRAELLEVLRLSDCSFGPDPASAAVLGRRGELGDVALVYREGGFELPPQGVAIPVLHAGEPVGYLRCAPTPGAPVSIARRRAAVTIADLLGAAR
jgi:K+-sensing histidine kinase KdpD